MGINSYVPTQQSPECPVVPVPFALSCRRDRTCGERSRTKSREARSILSVIEGSNQSGKIFVDKSEQNAV